MTDAERNAYIVRIRSLERTLAAIAREPDCIFQRVDSRGMDWSGKHDAAVVCKKCYDELKRELREAEKTIALYRRVMNISQKKEVGF